MRNAFLPERQSCLSERFGMEGKRQMERILKNGEPDVKTDLAACYGIQAEKILRIAGGTVGRTYGIDNRHLLKIYDTDTAVGKLGMQRLPIWVQALERLQESGLRDRICRPVRTAEGSFFMCMTESPERFFPSFREKRWGMAGPTPVRR